MSLSLALLADIRSRYQLDWDGIHGAAHWARVRSIGKQLAQQTPGADAAVVEAFALLHDSCREDDGQDLEHGTRAAAYCQELARRGVLKLSAHQLQLLVEACTIHSDGGLAEDSTVACCLDADRLDLTRLGYQINPSKLSTVAARNSKFIRRAD